MYKKTSQVDGKQDFSSKQLKTSENSRSIQQVLVQVSVGPVHVPGETDDQENMKHEVKK